MSIESYLRAVPKAELHVHLEGSIQPATLLTLAKRNNIKLPADNVESLRKWFTFSNFSHFVDIYGTICHCLQTSEDFELITHEFGAEMARQNIRYAEVTFTPGAHYQPGILEPDYMKGLTRGRERAKTDFGVEISWVFDIIRDTGLTRPDWQATSTYADYTLEVAIENMANGVVALGLGGMEEGYPPEPFAPWFEQAKAAGLNRTPHAGETLGPDSIWSAIKDLQAQRIGHGVRAIEDAALVRYLVERQIPLELNPTSNLRLGVYPDYARHPLRQLYEAGVSFSVNSDDPPLFNTTLTDEILLLSTEFHFDLATIDEILLNGIRHSFLPPGRKQELEDSFRVEMDTLKAQHLFLVP